MGYSSIHLFVVPFYVAWYRSLTFWVKKYIATSIGTISIQDEYKFLTTLPLSPPPHMKFAQIPLENEEKWCSDSTLLHCHFLTKSCSIPQLCGNDYLHCGRRLTAFPGPWSVVVLLVIYRVNSKLNFPILPADDSQVMWRHVVV